MLIISLKALTHEQQHDYAHSLLKSCLLYHGTELNEDKDFIFNKYGKPSLKDFPDIHFNVTHADGITAAVTSCVPCGIDAEPVREYRPNVMRRVFSESERKLVEEALPEKRDELFFRLWTLKESYVKMLGIGISYPMKTVEFSFEGGGIISSAENCRFRQYVIDGRFVVSVCRKINF